MADGWFHGCAFSASLAVRVRFRFWPAELPGSSCNARLMFWEAPSILFSCKSSRCKNHIGLGRFADAKCSLGLKPGAACVALRFEIFG